MRSSIDLRLRGPDDILAHVHELKSAGASRVEFGTPHGLDAASGIRLLGEHILPRARA